jgi:hypothetical protein
MNLRLSCAKCNQRKVCELQNDELPKFWRTHDSSQLTTCLAPLAADKFDEDSMKEASKHKRSSKAFSSSSVMASVSKKKKVVAKKPLNAQKVTKIAEKKKIADLDLAARNFVRSAVLHTSFPSSRR